MALARFHIVQGGIGHDKRQLKNAAIERSNIRSWIAPKSAELGDKLAIHIVGQGLFATAVIASQPKPRKDWKYRYCAALKAIKLIEPPISIAAL